MKTRACNKTFGVFKTNSLNNYLKYFVIFIDVHFLGVFLPPLFKVLHIQYRIKQLNNENKVFVQIKIMYLLFDNE